MSSSFRSRRAASTARIATRLEDDAALTEVSAVFVLPAAAAPWGGPDVLRYTVEVTTPGGDRLYLRSHGLTFNAHPKPWLGQGITGSFSVGPGLVEGRERLVVLAQAFDRDAAAALSLVAADPGWAAPPLRSEVACYGRTCSLLSGIVGP